MTRLARAVCSRVRMTLRARIVLLAAQGLQNKHIAQALGVGRVRSRAGASATCSTRKMDAVLDVSASTVMRHWQANGLKPQILRGFKVSRDPKFVEKLEDIVGAHLGIVAEQGRALLPRHLREPLAPGWVQKPARTRDCHR